MPRNMSFAATTQQILDQTKTVTRRKYTKAAAEGRGWMALKPGDWVWAVEKGMGLAKGEKVNRLALLKIVEVSLEPLNAIIDQPQDVVAEGFPTFTADEFMGLFIEMNGRGPGQLVIRIEFEYLNEIGEDQNRVHVPVYR